MISLIVPTYNEKEILKSLYPQSIKLSAVLEYEIIVVDDNSPDGTASIAEELSKEYPVRVLKRSGKLGLASAVICGFKHARGEMLGVIDADLQHPPEYIQSLRRDHEWSGYRSWSRYVPGGKIEGWSRYRALVSKGAIMLSKPITEVKDPMSGYFLMKKKVIENVSFNPVGYKILLEILAKDRIIK